MTTVAIYLLLALAATLTGAVALASLRSTGGRKVTEPAVIHCTPAELQTELFWSLHIDPVAREHGMSPPAELDARDPGRHLLRDPDGQLLLIVMTDRGAADA